MTTLLKKVFFALILLHNTISLADKKEIPEPITQDPALIHKNHYELAIPVYNTISLADKKEIHRQFALGYLLINKKKYEQAIAIFAELIKKYPSFPQPYNNLAFIYASQGDYMKAQDVLQAAFKNNPSYSLVYDNLNMIYAKIAQGIYEKAIGAKDTSREPLKNLYLIDHVFGEIEDKTVAQNNDPEKNNVSSINNAPINANMIPPPLSEGATLVPPMLWPKYITIISILLAGIGIGLTIKEAWHHLLSAIRRPKALKRVEFSQFFGILNENTR